MAHSIATPLNKPASAALVAVVPLATFMFNEKVLREVIAGCEGPFLDLKPSFTDPVADVRQGKSIIAIHRKSCTHQARHLFDQNHHHQRPLRTYQPHGRIPQFKEEFGMYRGLAETGTFTTAPRPNTAIPCIGEYDLAAFAVAAFEYPARFHRQEVPVASATYTTEEILKSFYLFDEEAAEMGKMDIFIWSQEREKASVDQTYGGTQ
ncbi:putative NAD dependent epimerase/dehydratase [Nemania serpens]|nr:putative NAD dependent epimerase/dehydratase [Nemania serpens]